MAHIEFADGTSAATFEQPSIDALTMEEVHAGHSPQLLARLVLDQADHAFGHSLLFMGLGLVCSDLLLRDCSDR